MEEVVKKRVTRTQKEYDTEGNLTQIVEEVIEYEPKQKDILKSWHTTPPPKPWQYPNVMF